MILAGNANFFATAGRWLLSLIDGVAYWLLVTTYNLFTEITRVNIFGDDAINKFSNRIYTIIAVVMLFKLAFSIINYILDPDKLADSKTGFQSIIKNIIVMLVMLVTVPLVFKYATALQFLVIEDDTIGRLITGLEGGTTKNAGEQLATSILSGFIYPNETVCPSTFSDDECRGKLNDIKKGLGDKYYDAFTVKGGYSLILSTATSDAEDFNGDYAIEYKVILSTLVGGFAAYIFLLFCIDISIRMVKFAFLQLIAPIPIVMTIDEKGKNGIFKKWVNNCVGTYLELFVKIAAVRFAIYLLSTFILNAKEMHICHWTFENNVLTQNCDDPASPLIKIFIIIGALSFAKVLPKLIEDMTGLKLGGDFTLNPMKKLSSIPLIGGAAAAGAALGGRTALNMAKGLGTGGLNLAKFGGKALGGAIAGSAAGQAVKNKIDDLKTTQGYQNIAGAMGAAKKGITTGAGWLDDKTGHNFSKIGADVGGTVGGITNKLDDKKMAKNKKQISAFEALKKMAQDDISKNKAGRLSDEYNAWQAKLERLKSENISRSDYMINKQTGTDAYGRPTYEQIFNEAAYNDAVQAHDTELAQALSDYGTWFNKTAVDNYITGGINSNGPVEYDREIINADGSKTIEHVVDRYEASDDFKLAYQAYADAARNAGHEIEKNYSSMKSNTDKLTRENTKIENKKISQQEAKKGN